MKFIVFEGVDGSGKSTMIRHLEKQRLPVDVHFTAEPYVAPNPPEWADEGWFRADRWDHETDVIKPIIEAGGNSGV